MAPRRRTPTLHLPLPRLASIVLVTTLLTGCLFPPVEVADPDDDGDPPRPSPTERPQPTTGPTRVSEETVSYQDAGQVEGSATVGDRRLSTERHSIELPPYMVRLTFRLDWEPQAGEDLDVTLGIHRDGEVLWTHSADEGRTGAPDRPIERTFELPGDAYVTDATLLVIDIAAEVAYETSYTLSGTYTYHATRAA